MVEEAISDEGGSSSTADVNDDKDDKIITPCAQLTMTVTTVTVAVN